MSEAPPEVGPRTALSFLWGARVQRVDAPSPTLFVLTLYDRGRKECLVFALTPRRAGLGLVQERPSGQPASAFVRRLRTALENARFIEARWLGGPTVELATAVELVFERGEAQARVVVDFDPAQPNLYLMGVGAAVVGAADERARRLRFPGSKALFRANERGGIPLIETREAALQQGSTLVEGGARSSDQALRAQAAAQARAALKRLSRKALAIREDLARADSAPLLRREANLLLCQLSAVAAGAREVQIEDISSDPVETLNVQLDPALSAQENAERRFVRARRMERGARIARDRLEQTDSEIAALTSFSEGIQASDLDRLLSDAAALGLKLDASPLHGRPSDARKGRKAHVAYRVFQGAGDARILVGKGAADNDALTLTVARPHDVWLHARGLQGAHVIVPRERGQDMPPELLLDAAHLALHFSSARGDPSAEVQHVERRYIRKPKGSPPGAVRVDRERVLLLRVEPKRLARLLASERSA